MLLLDLKDILYSSIQDVMVISGEVPHCSAGCQRSDYTQRFPGYNEGTLEIEILLCRLWMLPSLLKDQFHVFFTSKGKLTICFLHKAHYSVKQLHHHNLLNRTHPRTWLSSFIVTLLWPFLKWVLARLRLASVISTIFCRTQKHSIKQWRDQQCDKCHPVENNSMSLYWSQVTQKLSLDFYHQK